VDESFLSVSGNANALQYLWVYEIGKATTYPDETAAQQALQKYNDTYGDRENAHVKSTDSGGSHVFYIARDGESPA
jgi:hypothetical protein